MRVCAHPRLASSGLQRQVAVVFKHLGHLLSRKTVLGLANGPVGLIFFCRTDSSTLFYTIPFRLVDCAMLLLMFHVGVWCIY